MRIHCLVASVCVRGPSPFEFIQTLDRFVLHHPTGEAILTKAATDQLITLPVIELILTQFVTEISAEHLKQFETTN